MAHFFGVFQSNMKIIFIHGLGQNKTAFQSTIDAIQPTPQAVCVDFSKFQNTEVNYSKLYQEVETLCNAEEGKIHIVGLSLGGLLAIDYASKNPHKIASLVLINTQCKMPTWLLKLQNMVFACLPNKAFASGGFSKQNMISICKSMEYLDFTKQVSTFPFPVCVVHGAKDGANKKAAQKLYSLLSNAIFCSIENAGHEINIQNPKALAEAIQNFYKFLDT